MLQHLKAVWTFRYFWMSLVGMDLRSRYRRSFLGIGWSLLQPLAMTAVFCLVFSHLMANPDADATPAQPVWQTYACFLVTGLAVWGFIQTSTAIGCHALLQNEAYIRQCPLPYGIYPLRTVLGTAIHFLISFSVAVVTIAVFQGPAVFGRLWAVLPLVPLLILFCWSVATIAAFATVYFHDTAHLVEVGSQLFFFLTPLMYTRQVLAKNGVEFLADINPVNLFLEVMRDPLLMDKTGKVLNPLPGGEQYLAVVVLTAAAVGLAFGTIGWLQKKVIFHM